MAKGKAKVAGTTAPAQAKFNSAGKKRSTADLAGSEKGNIIRVIRGAASLANVEANSRKGLNLGVKDSAKNLAGRLNSIVKPGGKIDLMDAGSENYGKLKSLAKSALGSLKSSSYDASVKELLTFCLTALSSGTGGGKKGFNPAALSDISF